MRTFKLNEYYVILDRTIYKHNEEGEVAVGDVVKVTGITPGASGNHCRVETYDGEWLLFNDYERQCLKPATRKQISKYKKEFAKKRV